MKESTLEHQIAIQALEDQTVCRLQQINTLQIEFLRQFECHIANPSTHPQLVYQIRNLIFIIQDTYLSMKEYFQDIKMEHVYGLFRKIQILMVNGYNFLSQALLFHIDQVQMERDLNQQSKNRERMKIKKVEEKQQSQERVLDHCDYRINILELQENKLKEEIHKIQDHLLMSKGLVERLHPSKAVKELTQIKQQSQITLEHSQKIFEETYNLKYLEFKSYLASLIKPDDLTKQLCDNIKVAVKDKFSVGMSKTVSHLYQLTKDEERKKGVTSATQTEEDDVKVEKKIVLKPGQKLQNLLLKERKFTEKLHIDIGILKKEIGALKQQKTKALEKVSELQAKNKQVENNHEILKNLYEEQREYIVNLLGNCKHQSQKVLELRAIEARYLGLIPKNQEACQTEPLSSEHMCVQVKIDEELEMMAILRKQNEKMRQKIIVLESNFVNKKGKANGNGGVESPSKLLKFNVPEEDDDNIHTRGQMTKRSLSKTNLKEKIKENKGGQSKHNIALKNSRATLKALAQGSVVGTLHEVGGNLKSKNSTRRPSKLGPAIIFNANLAANLVNFKNEDVSDSDDSACIPLKRNKSRRSSKLSQYEQIRSSTRRASIDDREPMALQQLFIEAATQTEPVNIQILSIKKKEKNDGRSSLPFFQRADHPSKTMNLSTRFRGDKRKGSTINRKKNRKAQSDDFDQEDQDDCYPLQRQHFQQINMPPEVAQRGCLKKRSIFSNTQPFFMQSLKHKTQDVMNMKQENNVNNLTCREQDFRSLVSSKRESKRDSRSTNKDMMIAVDRIMPGINTSRGGKRTNTKCVKSQFEQKASKENRSSIDN